MNIPLPSLDPEARGQQALGGQQFVYGTRLAEQSNAAQMARLQAEMQNRMALGGLESQTALQRTGMETSAATEQARIAAQAAELPAQLKQQRFQQMFPLFQGAFDMAKGLLGGGGSAMLNQLGG